MILLSTDYCFGVEVCRFLPLGGGDFLNFVLQMSTADSDLTKDNLPHFIAAVLGQPLLPVDHRIVSEQTVVIKDIDLFQDAVAMFLGIIYVLNLKYNSKVTFAFMLRGPLKPEEKLNAKKAVSLWETNCLGCL